MWASLNILNARFLLRDLSKLNVKRKICLDRSLSTKIDVVKEIQKHTKRDTDGKEKKMCNFISITPTNSVKIVKKYAINMPHSYESFRD
jgi:hypothetical protein